MQSISDGCLRALSHRRPFRNRLTLPMLDHFKAQTKIGSQIRLQNLFVRVAQSYPANDSCIFQVKESTTIPIKPGRDLISEISCCRSNSPRRNRRKSWSCSTVFGTVSKHKAI